MAKREIRITKKTNWKSTNQFDKEILFVLLITNPKKTAVNSKNKNDKTIKALSKIINLKK